MFPNISKNKGCPCVAGSFCDFDRCRECPANSSSLPLAENILGCYCHPGYHYVSDMGIPCLPDEDQPQHDAVDSDSWMLRATSQSTSIPPGFPIPKICYSSSDCKYDGCGVNGACDASWACWLSKGSPVCTSPDMGMYACAICPAPGEVTCDPPCSWDAVRAKCSCPRCPPGRSAAVGSQASDCMLERYQEPTVGALCNQTNLASIALLDGTACVMCKPGTYSLDGLPCSACPTATTFGSAECLERELQRFGAANLAGNSPS
jgi:hypothetical protein